MPWSPVLTLDLSGLEDQGRGSLLGNTWSTRVLLIQECLELWCLLNSLSWRSEGWGKGGFILSMWSFRAS